MKSRFSLLMLYRAYVTFCILVSFSFSEPLFAQGVGINTISPDPSSALDIQGDNKGVLIPRVALTSLTDAATIVNPANSLLVWNTNAALAFGSGYYYNSGSSAAPQWSGIEVKKATAMENKVAFRVSGVGGGTEKIAKNSDVTLNFTSEDYDIGNNYSGNIFTVPVDGIYHFDATIHYTNHTTTPPEVSLLNSFDSPMFLKLERNNIKTNLCIALSAEVQTSASSLYYGKITTDVKLIQGDKIYLDLGFYPEQYANPEFTNGDFLFVDTDNIRNQFNGRLETPLAQ